MRDAGSVCCTDTPARQPEYPAAATRLYIYSFDLRALLATHDVTWSRKDSFFEGQYEEQAKPGEFPTAPVRTQIRQLPKPSMDLFFAKFNFDEEDPE